MKPLILMPTVFVGDIDRSIRFFEALGLQMSLRSRTHGWAEFDVGGAILALHQADLQVIANDARMELCFLAQEPLYEIEERCRANQIPIERPVTDERFGSSMVIRDPDGTLIQINEHDVELYGEIVRPELRRQWKSE